MSSSRGQNELSFPTISKEHAAVLSALIKKLERQCEMNIDRNSDHASKFRAKAKEKFTNALVLILE